jgi:hypothetical protein
MKQPNFNLKSKPNNKTMQSFTLKNIPNLDICVLGALELFSDKNSKIPKLKIPYKKPLVVGSGNAEATGKIMFSDKGAIFATESNFKEKLNKIKGIDGVVIVSASGAKHALVIAKYSKQKKKHLTLITNTENSPTNKFLDQKHNYDSFIFPKQREPYTYNTSTYMGMIFGKTNESPKDIYKFIKNNTSKLHFPNFKKYKKIYILVPIEYSGVLQLIKTKFIELFGRQIAVDLATIEAAKHATTLVPAKNELFISFGEKNRIFGKHKFFVPLPKKAGQAAMMAIGYYVVGQIQKSNSPYFKKHLKQYTEKASKIFKSDIKPIVE